MATETCHYPATRDMFFPERQCSRAGGRTTMVERGGLSAATPAWLHTRRGAIGRTLRTTIPKIADLRPLAYIPRYDHDYPATRFANVTPTRRGQLP
jgi:hypothetical protein